jgi:hypothetical protein
MMQELTRPTVFQHIPHDAIRARADLDSAVAERPFEIAGHLEGALLRVREGPVHAIDHKIETLIFAENAVFHKL